MDDRRFWIVDRGRCDWGTMGRSIITAILFALGLVGCITAPIFDSVQHELDNIANCLETATWLLQAEPGNADSVAAFLSHASAAAAKRSDLPDGSDFDLLNWNKTKSKLITQSGLEIVCRINGTQHDNYGPAGTAFVTEYEFYIPSTGKMSRVLIELKMN